MLINQLSVEVQRAILQDDMECLVTPREPECDEYNEIHQVFSIESYRELSRDDIDALNYSGYLGPVQSACIIGWSGVQVPISKGRYCTSVRKIWPR